MWCIYCTVKESRSEIYQQIKNCQNNELIYSLRSYLSQKKSNLRSKFFSRKIREKSDWYVRVSYSEQNSGNKNCHEILNNNYSFPHIYTCVPAHNDAKALKSLAAVCFTVPSGEVRRPSTAVCNTQITHWCLSNLHRYCDVKISVNVDNLPYVGLPWHILAGHYPCRQS